MRAARIRRFGQASVITIDYLPRPEPGAGELLVRVKAAGVGHWDALIREGKVQGEPLPLILGSELSGMAEAIGAGVSGFKTGDEVYGATNEQFTGAYSEFALASATKMAAKPKTLKLHRGCFRSSSCRHGLADALRLCPGDCRADRAHPRCCRQRWRVRRTAGQQVGLHVIATSGSADFGYVRGLGAERVVDYKKERFEDFVTEVDVVLDTVGGETQLRSLRVRKPGGILVSVVSPVPEEVAQDRYAVRTAYFYVDVTTERLNTIAELSDSGKLVADVGTVLPLEKARMAHEMLDGARINAARSC